jgi:hypothetical protein
MHRPLRSSRSGLDRKDKPRDRSPTPVISVPPVRLATGKKRTMPFKLRAVTA